MAKMLIFGLNSRIFYHKMSRKFASNFTFRASFGLKISLGLYTSICQHFRDHINFGIEIEPFCYICTDSEKAWNLVFYQKLIL